MSKAVINRITKSGLPIPLALNGTKVPPMWQVHGALIMFQIIHGSGAVIGKFGIANFNPAVFTLIRDAIAGPLLILLALCSENAICIPWKDVPWFLISGLCLFTDQICFMLGLKLSSAIMASAWTPSHSIFTTVISVILGWEKVTMLKIPGIIVAFLGAAFMVLTSESNFGRFSIKVGDQDFIGNVLFFVSCLNSALYVIFSRRLLKSHPTLVVAGWSHISCCVWMGIGTVVINSVPLGVAFLCPPELGTNEPSCAAWHVPYDATIILALLYWILFCSVAAYFFVTWGSQYALPSNVLAYSALRPLVTASLTVLIKSCGHEGHLAIPGYNLLGGVAIVFGLYLLIADGRIHHKQIKCIVNLKSYEERAIMQASGRTIYLSEVA